MVNLFVFLFTVIFGLGAMISYLNNSARLKLREMDSTEKRTEYRKHIYKRRIKTILSVAGAPILVLIISWFGMISISSSTEDTKEWKMWLEMFVFLLLIIIVIAGPLALYMYILYRGNLSYYDKNTFLKTYNDFVLYLRGFENDDYSYRMDLMKIKKESFSEYQFTKLLSKKCICTAIGMTKELDAPLGAIRIYVDDSTWKQDVRDLMEKSSQIYVLINNRPSCIWEIETAVEFIDKVVFVVDDPVKYVLVQEAVKSILQFPTIPSLSMANRFFYLLRINGLSHYFEYDNTKKGYQNLLNESLKLNRNC